MTTLFSFPRFIAGLLATTISLSAFASGGHGHDDEHGHDEPAKGPNGGILLEKPMASGNEFQLEMTIFESGIPPEMRVYAYESGQPVSPEDIRLSVTFHRLGDQNDVAGFDAEQDYLVSNIEVTEPHSFDVSVDATYKGKRYEWHYENHEGRTELTERMLTLAEIGTDFTGPQTLVIKDTLFGVIEAPQNSVYRVHAPWQGLVSKVHVNIGDKVKQGQVVATLENTTTLKQYQVKAPATGEVTARNVNPGDRSDEQPLIEIADLSEVWVEMSAFPENIERLKPGQQVSVYDLHHHLVASSTISYIAPQMTGGHIARARAVISNTDGHWRPGMHVKADITIDEVKVPMAVKTSAIQTFREMPVVFARFGNVFEVRMIQPGLSDDTWTEVTGGIAPGREYVTDNSYILKADILKDGASHDH